jgi:hypothetical protein
MKLTLSALRKIVRRVISPGSSSRLEPDVLKGMVRSILTTRPDEIGCDECFEQLDRFIELTLTGMDAAQAMPLVQDHLDRCGDCREEFEALLEALRAVA